MRKKVLTTSSGDHVYVYDDVYNFSDTFHHQKAAQRRSFCFKAPVDGHLEYASDTFLYSSVTEDEAKQLGIMSGSGFDEIATEHFDSKKFQMSWVLNTVHLATYCVHPDLEESQGAKTFLYYCNPRWDPEWGGETIFCDSSGDADLAVTCKPNRVVVFDSFIAHKPAAMTHKTFPYRFTYTAIFKNE